MFFVVVRGRLNLKGKVVKAGNGDIKPSESLLGWRMTVRVDDQPPLATENCETGMCYFDVAKSKKLLRQFRRGRSARILIMGSGSRVLFDGEITLIGFTAAFRRY